MEQTERIIKRYKYKLKWHIRNIGYRSKEGTKDGHIIKQLPQPLPLVKIAGPQFNTTGFVLNVATIGAN